MRYWTLAIILASVAPLSVATAETGDEGSRAAELVKGDADDASAHPAPYPHIHPRRRVVQVAPAAPPPRYNSRTGGYIGLGGLGNFFIQGEDEFSKIYRGGGGFDLFLGFRLNDFIAFEFGWLAAFQEVEQSTTSTTTLSSGAMQSVYFDGKIFIVPSSERIEPFVQLGVGAYILSESLNAELTGFGFHIGGGVDVRLSDFVALGLKLMYHGFYVDNSDRYYQQVPTESAFLNTVSIEGNVQFHF